MGLLVGSGIVESSCGTLVAARFKLGGMRWSKACANDTLSLHACVRSGPYDGFWQRCPPCVPGALKRRAPWPNFPLDNGRGGYQSPHPNQHRPGSRRQ